MALNEKNPIRSTRDERKISLFRLGVLTGLHPNTIRAAENGMLTPRVAAAIAKALGLDVDVLLGNREAP